MKKIKFSTLIFPGIIFIICCLLSPASHAGTYNMIFWYPGEAGTTEDARGVLDSFFESINREIAPDRISGKYLNGTEEGLNYIMGKRPAIGIVSFATYSINREKMGNPSIILQTLPLPNGKPTENYTIVGKGPRPLKWDVTLYTRQPLTSDFVRKYLLDTSDSFKLNPVNNIFPTLKKAAAGEINGGIILQPMEYFTFRQLNQLWVKELSIWHTSPAVPSAPVVAFSKDTRLVEKLKNAFLKMQENPQGRAILETLRLKGFVNEARSP